MLWCKFRDFTGKRNWILLRGFNTKSFCLTWSSSKTWLISSLQPQNLNSLTSSKWPTRVLCVRRLLRQALSDGCHERDNVVYWKTKRKINDDLQWLSCINQIRFRIWRNHRRALVKRRNTLLHVWCGYPPSRQAHLMHTWDSKARPRPALECWNINKNGMNENRQSSPDFVEKNMI